MKQCSKFKVCFLFMFLSVQSEKLTAVKWHFAVTYWYLRVPIIPLRPIKLRVTTTVTAGTH